MKKIVERYADNGSYSHSELIDSETGEFICYVCPICGAQFDNEEEHKICT